MDRMTAMVTFVKVIEAGGFAAAGRKLGISPSTVTTQVQTLEERLGARLLNRSTRRVSLTEIGKAYHERCLRVLADMEEADNVVDALRAAPRGNFRVNVSAGVPVLLAPIIAEFTSLYPDVSLNLIMTDHMIDLVEEGIDLALRISPIPDSNLVMRRVGSFRLLVCGAPSYFAIRGVPEEPSDLKDHNCMRYSFSAWGSDWRFEGFDGQNTVHVGGNFESNSTNALKAAAVLGHGLIRMPEFMLTDEIHSGALVPVLTDFCCPEKPINAVYPHRHHLSANVRSFLELVAKRLRNGDEEIDGADASVPLLVAADGGPPSPRLVA